LGTSLGAVLSSTRLLVRWLSLHTGVPALIVAAILICVGCRLLKRTVRLLVEIAILTVLLTIAVELGWLRW
jgi:hypothetical protein